MKKTTLFSAIILITAFSRLFAQYDNEPVNLSSSILNKSEDKLVFGGYGQVDFYKPFDDGRRMNSTLDVTRLILSMGYNFSSKTSFFSEIEFEHVRELFIEQAFVNHSFVDAFNFRAGLMLVPMGIINEYHEPTTFNGVNRPSVDNLIVPTTWREIGIGLTGRFLEQGLKYQVYLFNGFSGHDGTKGLITGERFLRDARQRGARAIMSAPDLSFKLDFFGISGLKLGLSGYFGQTESALLRNVEKTNDLAVAKADSSVVGLTMAGLDARYNIGGLSLRGELILASLSNTGAYNGLTGNNAGSQVYGFYGEIAYNLIRNSDSGYGLTPFFRYENYNTHYKVVQSVTKLDKYEINEFVFGIGCRLAEGAALKTDIQIAKPSDGSSVRKTFNAGVALWF